MIAIDVSTGSTLCKVCQCSGRSMSLSYLFKTWQLGSQGHLHSCTLPLTAMELLTLYNKMNLLMMEGALLANKLVVLKIVSSNHTRESFLTFSMHIDTTAKEALLNCSAFTGSSIYPKINFLMIQNYLWCTIRCNAAIQLLASLLSFANSSCSSVFIAIY